MQSQETHHVVENAWNSVLNEKSYVCMTKKHDWDIVSNNFDTYYSSAKTYATTIILEDNDDSYSDVDGECKVTFINLTYQKGIHAKSILMVI